ncbi:MAG: amino acid racemase [Gammaproteobacteria bacterium]|nr:amino acid racemase [Gammaproteobacteria bacterium]
MIKKIGVFGGLGPLASAKFVETIYFCGLQNVANEQELVEVILYSKPSIPDRTEYLLQGKTEVLFQELSKGIEKLISCGAEKIIVCCFTMHYLIPQLKENIRSRIIQLPSILLLEIIKQRKTVLLLCTKGAKKLKIFEKDLLWNHASKYIVRINDDDQELVHNAIYKIKKNDPNKVVSNELASLLKKYKANILGAGCTEFHLLSSKQYFNSMEDNFPSFIDPLITIAESLVLPKS